MKRYYYNNWLAKVLLYFSTCHTITLGWFVLSKRSFEEIPQEVKNHETIHSMQWTELTMVSGLILLVLVLWLNVTPWWMLAAPCIYYLWYVLEYLIKVFTVGYRAYRHISFELEAYENQNDDDYVENRRMFTGWLKKVSSIV